MSFRLGPDGKPVEIESSFVKSDDKPKHSTPEGGTKPPQGQFGGQGGRPKEGATQPPGVDLFNHMKSSGSGMRPGGVAVSPEPPTRPANIPGGSNPAGSSEQGTIPPKGQEPAPKPVVEEPKTSINFGGANIAVNAGGDASNASAESFVCGWLVVVDGPGKGKSVVIGPGQSAISRSPTERITLNFGDTSITSKQQLLVIYDDENREFIVAPGNGSSLNRVNGQIVAGQTVLETGSLLKVGATTLRFVAFCDQNFNWE
ncbi:FHA domain-containing protein [Aliiglaciecola aliphaticivorans]